MYRFVYSIFRYKYSEFSSYFVTDVSLFDYSVRYLWPFRHKLVINAAHGT